MAGLKLVFFDDPEGILDTKFRSLTLKTLFEQAILGQRRTTTTRAYVFLWGDYVVKGPYRSVHVADTVMTRYEQMKIWGSKLLLQPIGRATIDGKAFLIFDNFIKDEEIEFELQPDVGTDQELRTMVSRPRYVKLSDDKALKDRTFRTKFYGQTKVLTQLIYEYILLYILKTGDVGTSNTLVDPDYPNDIILLDIDETTTRTVDTDQKEASVNKTFYFRANPAKAYEWETHVHTLYPQVIKLVWANVKASELDADAKARYKFAIKQLGIMAQADKSSPLEESDSGSSLDVPILKLNKPSSSTKLKSGTGKLPKLDIGGMHLIKGYRGPKGMTYSCNRPELWEHLDITKNPFSVGTMKSVLQKAIRRGHTTTAIKAATEMYRMHEIDFATGTKGLLKRLSVIAVEDVGPADVDLCYHVVTRINIWLYSTRFEVPDFESVIKLVILLSLAPKTRIISHLWACYVRPEGMAKAIEGGHYTQRDLARRSKEPKPKGIFDPQDSSHLITVGSEFYHRLVSKDPLSIYFLSRYMTLAAEGAKIHKSGNEPIPRILQPEARLHTIFLKLMPRQTEIIDVMMKAYYKAGNKSSDRRIYPMLLTLMYLMDLAKYDIQPVKFPKVNLEPILDLLLEGKYNLYIDPDALDKHTEVGKLKGEAGTREFREVGA